MSVLRSLLSFQPYQVEHTNSCLITAVEQLWAETRHQTFFSDYWLCKIPCKEIFPLYLLYVSYAKKEKNEKKNYLRFMEPHYTGFFLGFLHIYEAW